MFSNIKIFSITEPWLALVAPNNEATSQLDCDALFGQKLSDYKSVPMTDQESSRQGFAKPFPFLSTDELYFRTGDWLIVSVKTQTRRIPKSFLDERLESKVQEYVANNEGAPVSTRQRRVFKAELAAVLLPMMPPVSRAVLSAINTKENYIVVGSGSSRDAEDSLAFLRKALGSLPAVHFFDQTRIEKHLYDWVYTRGTSLPAAMQLGYNASFDTVDETKSSAKFRNVMLTTDDVNGQLEDKLCTELELVLVDTASFSITDAGVIKKLQLHDTYRADNQDENPDDAAAAIEADLALQFGCLGLVLNKLSNLVRKV